MKKHLFYSLLMLISLMGCNAAKANPEAEGAEEAEEGLPVINLSENVKEVSALNLSDAAERVEIVKLETSDKVFLSNVEKVEITDDNIYVSTMRSVSVYRFTRDGKFLNTIGKRGQGPGEYITLVDFLIDNDTKEIYIETGSQGILVFDFEGHLKRYANKEWPEKLFDGGYAKLVVYKGNYLVFRNIPVLQMFHPNDPLWSVAITDNTFTKQKIFKNPAHIGHEKDILSDEHRGHGEGWYQYWREELTTVDFTNNELTFKLPDTDTIYVYETSTQTYKPKYSIYTGEEKGDYELMHEWVKQRKSFDYYTYGSYHPTPTSIYFIGSKGEQIYTYRYDKTSHSVSMVKRKGIITERKDPFVQHYGRPLLRLERNFILTNDINGGDFLAKFRSNGRYWIQPLIPGSSDYEKFVEDLKASPAAPQKQQLLDVIAKTGEEDNPILLIAVLK